MASKLLLLTRKYFYFIRFILGWIQTSDTVRGGSLKSHKRARLRNVICIFIMNMRLCVFHIAPHDELVKTVQMCIFYRVKNIEMNDISFQSTQSFNCENHVNGMLIRTWTKGALYIHVLWHFIHFSFINSALRGFCRSKHWTSEMLGNSTFNDAASFSFSSSRFFSEEESFTKWNLMNATSNKRRKLIILPRSVDFEWFVAYRHAC